MSHEGYANLAYALEHLGRQAEALEQYAKGLELTPSDPDILLEMAQIYGEGGAVDKASEYGERAETVLGTSAPAAWLGRLGTAYAIAGRHVDARRILNHLYTLADRQYIPPTCPAVICAALGEAQTAIDLLEQAYEKRDVIMVWLKVRHHFDPLRGDPRFETLLRRMNFPDR